MRLLVITALIFLVPVFSSASDLDKYFKKFEEAASKKDKKALKALIYPLKLGNTDIQDELIESIFANDVNSTGDGAISLKALKALRKNHMDKFEQVPDVLFEEFKNSPDMGPVMSKLSQKDVMIFNHAGAKMILVKEKKDWQLLFWEDLNNLISA